MIGFGVLELLILLSLPFVGLGLLLWMIVKSLTGRQDSVRLSREEADQLRRMWDAFDRMEERIANLETLLLEKDKESHYDLRK